MKWVLNTYQVAQKWELDYTIGICQEAGYEGIEFMEDFGQPHGLEASASDDHVRSVKEKMDAAGLIVSSLSSSCSFHSLDEADRRRNIEQSKRVIDQAVIIGCDRVRVLGDKLPDDDAGKEPILNNVTAALRELGEYAQPKGIIVSLEAHQSFTDPIYATRVVKDAGMPNVGIVFNSQWRVGHPKGWSLPADATSIAPLYELFAPYLTSVHLHPMERPNEWRFYQEMFRLLVRDGYTGHISNECAYTGPDPAKVLRLYTTLFYAFTS